MVHINFQEPPRFSLLQFDFKSLKSFKNIELNYLLMMVILCVILIFMLSFGLVQRSRIYRMNEKLTVARAEAKAASGVQPAKEGAPKATLMSALLQRVAWSPILNAIANHTPDTIALNYIKGASTGNRSMQIEGAGTDVLATVRYEDELSTLPIFSKVFLKSSSGRGAGPSVGAPTAKSGGKADAKADARPDVKSDVKPTMATSDTSRSVFEIQAWLK